MATCSSIAGDQAVLLIAPQSLEDGPQFLQRPRLVPRVVGGLLRGGAGLLLPPRARRVGSAADAVDLVGAVATAVAVASKVLDVGNLYS